MTNRDAEEGNVTTPNGNRSAGTAAGVSDPVTVPRSPVPPGTDTPAVGTVPRTGNVPAMTVPVPAVVSGRPRWTRFTPEPGTGTGNGTGRERSHVPAHAVPDGQASQVEAKPAKANKTRDWSLVGMWSVIIAMNLMALALASSGQIDGTWKWAGLSGGDLRKWLLPGVTEVGYLGFLMLGQYALRRKQSPFLWWGCAAGVAAAAIFMNSVHGSPGFKFEQGLIFGVASGVSLAMTFAKFLIDYRDRRRRDGHTVGLRPRAWTIRAALSFPRLAYRADLIIARCERVATRERAYELAETWRWVYEDAKAGAGISRKTARRTAWMTVYQELGMKVIQPQNIKVATVTFAPPPPAPPVAPSPAPPVRRTPPVPNAPEPRNPAPSPPDPPVSRKVEKEVPGNWWSEHRDHIAAAQQGIPTWETQEKAPTVNEVQVHVGNRTNAAETAACLRVLRQRARASN